MWFVFGFRLPFLISLGLLDERKNIGLTCLMENGIHFCLLTTVVVSGGWLGTFVLLILVFISSSIGFFMRSYWTPSVLQLFVSWLFGPFKIQSSRLPLICIFFPLLWPSLWGVLDEQLILVPDFLLESPAFLFELFFKYWLPPVSNFSCRIWGILPMLTGFG